MGILAASLRARVRALAPALLVLVHASACSAEDADAATTRTVYRCAGNQSFTVARDARSALVEYSGARYVLPRRSSSIGDRYATRAATLIVDGDMAVFVSTSATNLEFCRATTPLTWSKTRGGS